MPGLYRRRLGASFVGINGGFRLLVEKGWINTRNFCLGDRKLCRASLLALARSAEKSKLTVGFLKRRTPEYAALEQRVGALEADLTSAMGDSQ
jgi:hypothetical protein